MDYAESGVRYKIWMLLKNGIIWGSRQSRKELVLSSLRD